MHPVPPSEAYAGRSRSLRLAGGALAILLALADAPAHRTGCHRSRRRAPRSGARARGGAADGDRSRWGTTSRPPPTTGAPGCSSAVFICSTPATGTCTAIGAIPTVSSIWTSPRRRSTSRCGSRWIQGWSTAASWTSTARSARSRTRGGTQAAWSHARPDAPSLPAYIVELGANLLTSCLSGGVLLTGSDLETVSVWYGSLQRVPFDILPLRPDLYATDSVYRLRMATAMGVDPALPVQRALAAVAVSRAICRQPEHGPRRGAGARLESVPHGPHRAASPTRGAGCHRAAQGRAPGGAPMNDVREVYDRAARYNTLLCSSLLMFFEIRRRRLVDGRHTDGEDGEACEAVPRPFRPPFRPLRPLRRR